MDVEEKIKIIKLHPLFQNLNHQAIKNLAQSSQEKIFAPKILILNQSEPAKSIYLIYKGLVKIYILNRDGRTIPIRIKEPTYLIGEMNLFDQESTATIETIQETRTLTFPPEVFTRLIINNSAFALDLLKSINEKLRTANKQTEAYFSTELKDRTMAILKTLAPNFPNNEVTLSQEDLSLIVGASRPRVSESLQQLVDQKQILVSHRKIKIL